LHHKAILGLSKVSLKINNKKMASKRTYYTRAHVDPNPAIIVDNPDKILRKIIK